MAAAVLALVSCQKEASVADGNTGDGISASFTVDIPVGDSTKAAADGDGAAASVNRCLMQVWWKSTAGDKLILEKSAAVTDLKAEFKNITLIKDQDYDFLFWADSAAVDAGGFSDLYYTTTDLHEVSIKGSYKANDDRRDAFFAAKAMTDVTTTFSETVKLYRPFAQLNIITTDAKAIYDQLPATDRDARFAEMMPDSTLVKFSAPSKFNVLTGKTVGGNVDFGVKVAVYKTPDATKDANSLTMDYIFAPEAESSVNTISFKATNVSGMKDVSRTFTNIPIQRNWRTNIKGKILSTTGEFNVEVVPAWDGEKNPEI